MNQTTLPVPPENTNDHDVDASNTSSSNQPADTTKAAGDAGDVTAGDAGDVTAGDAGDATAGDAGDSVPKEEGETPADSVEAKGSPRV